LLTDKQIRQIEQHSGEPELRYSNIMFVIGQLESLLTNQKAKEYLLHGAGRRANILVNCIRNIFSTYPVRKKDLLTEDERITCCISLHAFMINIVGFIDNLAWVFVHEKQLSIRKEAVSLFKEKTAQYLTPDFQSYLNTRKLWYGDYLLIYRHSLAHQIAPYIPPYGFIYDTGDVVPHAGFATTLDGNVMMLHPQLISDFHTIEEIIQNFQKFEFPVRRH